MVCVWLSGTGNQTIQLLPKTIRMPRDGMINQASQLLYVGFTTAWTEGQCSFMRCINKWGGGLKWTVILVLTYICSFNPSIISLQLSHGLFLIVLHSRSKVGIRNKTMITVGKKSWNLLYITNEVTSKDHVEKWPLLWKVVSTEHIVHCAVKLKQLGKLWEELKIEDNFVHINVSGVYIVLVVTR